MESVNFKRTNPSEEAFRKYIIKSIRELKNIEGWKEFDDNYWDVEFAVKGYKEMLKRRGEDSSFLYSGRNLRLRNELILTAAKRDGALWRNYDEGRRKE